MKRNIVSIIWTICVFIAFLVLNTINTRADTKFKDECSAKGGTSIYSAKAGWKCLAGKEIKL